jgi:hypothetical protein
VDIEQFGQVAQPEKIPDERERRYTDFLYCYNLVREELKQALDITQLTSIEATHLKRIVRECMEGARRGGEEARGIMDGLEKAERISEIDPLEEKKKLKRVGVIMQNDFDVVEESFYRYVFEIYGLTKEDLKQHVVLVAQDMTTGETFKYEGPFEKVSKQVRDKEAAIRGEGHQINPEAIGEGGYSEGLKKYLQKQRIGQRQSFSEQSPEDLI